MRTGRPRPIGRLQGLVTCSPGRCDCRMPRETNTPPAGSNYYFFDEEAGRTAHDPNDAVVGRDLWKDAGAVDLRPLEVIR